MDTRDYAPSAAIRLLAPAIALALAAYLLSDATPEPPTAPSAGEQAAAAAASSLASREQAVALKPQQPPAPR